MPMPRGRDIYGHSSITILNMAIKITAYLIIKRGKMQIFYFKKILFLHFICKNESVSGPGIK